VKYVKKKKTLRVYLSIGARIAKIGCVAYLLRIFKMFHGLMNNPVYTEHKSVTTLNGARRVAGMGDEL
jgi:hypothetical protein